MGLRSSCCVGALRFRGGDKVSIRERAEQLAYRLIRFQSLPSHRVAAGEKRKLMYRAVGVKNLPAGLADPAVNLRKPLAAVERLVVLPFGMTEARIDFVQPHEIEIVGRREEEFASGPRDTVHLGNGRLHLRQVLDGFAGNHYVERLIGKW